MKSYPAAIEAVIESGHIKCAHLLSVHLDVPFFYTDAGFDIHIEPLEIRQTISQGAEWLLTSGSPANRLKYIKQGQKVLVDGLAYKATDDVDTDNLGHMAIPIDRPTEQDIPINTMAQIPERPETCLFSHKSSVKSFEPIVDEGGLSVGEMSFAFFLTNTSIVSAILNFPYYKRKVKMHRVYLDNDNQVIENYIENLLSNRVKNMSDSDKQAQIVLTSSTRWSEYDRINARRTTVNNQQKYSIKDFCFKFAAMAQEIMYWAGRTRSN